MEIILYIKYEDEKFVFFCFFLIFLFVFHWFFSFFFFFPFLFCLGTEPFTHFKEIQKINKIAFLFLF